MKNVGKISLCLALAAAFATPLAAQEKAEGMPAEMLAAFEKMGAVGPNHELLESFAGDWDTHTKMWMDPSAPAMESKGSSSAEMIMDGRYLKMTYKGDMMGRPFDGLGMTAYDNMTSRFVNTWMDSMSTGIFYAEGSYDAASKTFTYNAEMADPMQPGTTLAIREVIRMIDKDKWTFEWYESRGGQEVRTMEITYTRKAS